MRRTQAATRARLRWAVVVIVGGFVVFGARLVQIQGFDTSAYAARAANAGIASSIDPAQRGQILDRNGVPLVSSVDAVTLTADPGLTATFAPQLARLLKQSLGAKVDYFDLIDTLRTPNSSFVYLVKDLPAYQAQDALDAIDKANETRPADQRLSGVFTEKQRIRNYPGGGVAANLMGIVNAAGAGVGGLEEQYNTTLKGTDGQSTYTVAPTGQRIPLAESDVKAMVPGSNIQTTIDRDLQWYSDQRLGDAVRTAGGLWGLAITMDVRTCEIVQLSQAPTFDAETGDHMNDLTMVSRSTQTVYEPGSVMKAITMAALADQGKIAPDTPIVVPDSMTVDGFKIGDYWKHGTLHLTATGVIAQSSNLGTVVASRLMSDKTMHAYLDKFGFGQLSGVELPNESRGILRDAEDWTASSHATIAFGQGIAVTAMQMVRAVNTIANDGVMCDPTVVQSVTDSEGRRTTAEPRDGHRVVSPEAARVVTRMMEGVTQKNGTAPAAAITGYRVAGKTGTAWRVDPATGRYIKGQNTISFMGFAPADEPRFITYVVIDRPGSEAGGGSHAAPVFHDIMSMALERFGIAPTGSRATPVPFGW